MYRIIIISIIFIGSFNSFSQDNYATLVLNELKIKDDNLINILKEISINEQEKYGKSDELLYEFSISRTHESIRKAMDNHESVYIEGVEDEWPIPSRFFNSVLGYIKIGNIFFIVSDGSSFPKDYFSNLFSITNIKKSFTLLEYKEKAVFSDDDSVIRVWYHFLYKDGQFKLVETLCNNNELITPYIDLKENEGKTR